MPKEYPQEEKVFESGTGLACTDMDITIGVLKMGLELKMEFRQLKALFLAGDHDRYVTMLLRLQRSGHPVVKWIKEDKVGADWAAFTALALDLRKEEAQGYLYLVMHQGNERWLRFGKTKFVPGERVKQVQLEIEHPVVLVKSWAVFDRFYFCKLVEERLRGVEHAQGFVVGDAQAMSRKVGAILDQEYELLRGLNPIGRIVPVEDRRTRMVEMA